MTHRELCELGAKYMYRNGTIPFNKPKYVVCELERIGECPDVFGFGFAYTQLLEIKVSRSDFLSDKKKEWRIKPDSPSTGNVVAFDGVTTWREEKIRNVFLSVSDCNVSARLHKTDDDTIRDFVNKMKLLKDEIQLFITHLEKEL